MRPGQVRAALRAARDLALLTRDAATVEDHQWRLQHHQWKRQVQTRARELEAQLTALGIKEERDGQAE